MVSLFGRSIVATRSECLLFRPDQRVRSQLMAKQTSSLSGKPLPLSTQSSYQHICHEKYNAKILEYSHQGSLKFLCLCDESDLNVTSMAFFFSLLSFTFRCSFTEFLSFLKKV
ncbi:uncharacterized protein LOC124318329 [Daphnia pulicaria]|uniref:uncharacterized protein LOC124318329 n=1 Tax=Daphnia pulicaria TaxID=35523 RepID=UPI001EEA92E6|nr:uncharacterized protein LOC124318103 isoform X2 [Daphnia pulicaria]XP_046638777.1 uncharacterized protein LOC124318329 [Daphnia pulicaria]